MVILQVQTVDVTVLSSSPATGRQGRPARRAGRLILLYPWHEELGEHEASDNKGILRTWKVAETGPGTACRLEVVVVDVGRPGAVAGALQAIVDSGASVDVRWSQADGAVEAALERS